MLKNMTLRKCVSAVLVWETGLILAAAAAAREIPVAFTGASSLGSSLLWSPRIVAKASCSSPVQPLAVGHQDKRGRWRGRRRRRRSNRWSSDAADAVAPTRMSLLRTFEASELELQRFIGELGFVEITDWYDLPSCTLHLFTASLTVYPLSTQ